MTASVIARVTYDFDTSGIEAANREIERMRRQLRGMGGNGPNSAGRSFATMASGAKVAAGAVAAIGAAFVGTIAGIAQWSRTTGLLRAEMEGLVTGTRNTITELNILGRAAAQYGLSQDKVNDQVKDFEDRIGDLMANGTGPLKDVFDRLEGKTNLTADALSRMSGSEGLAAVKKAMEDANIPMSEQFTLMEALADEGSKLALVFANNSEELNKAKQRYTDLNLEISKTDNKKLLALDQSVRDMDDSFNALTQRIVADLSPGITDLFNWMAEAMAGADEAIATISVTFGVLWDTFADRIKAVGRILFEGGFFGEFSVSAKEAQDGLLKITAGFVVVQGYITDAIIWVADLRKQFFSLANDGVGAVGTAAKDMFNSLVGGLISTGIYIRGFAVGLVRELTNAFTAVASNAKIFGDNLIELLTPGSDVSFESVFAQMKFGLGDGMRSALTEASADASDAMQTDYFGTWQQSLIEGFDDMIAYIADSDFGQKYADVLAQMRADIQEQVAAHDPDTEEGGAGDPTGLNPEATAVNVDLVIAEYERMATSIGEVLGMLQTNGQVNIEKLGNNLISFGKQWSKVTELSGKEQLELVGATVDGIKGGLEEGSAAHKAASVVSVTISTIAAAMKAYEQLGVYGTAAAAAIAGVGAASVASIIASADGNAFNNGNVTAFANGGAFTNSIATQPTMAPMALFGEAGPEAIMPLTRKNGKLGVEASGAGGGVNNNVSVVIQGNADPDLTREAVIDAMREVAVGEMANQQRTGGQLNPLSIDEVF